MAELYPGIYDGTPGSLTREERIERTVAELDQLVAAGRARMPAGGSGLTPFETDWMTEEEMARYHELQLRRMRLQGTRDDARARVAAKRAARRAAMGLDEKK